MIGGKASGKKRRMAASELAQGGHAFGHLMIS